MQYKLRMRMMRKFEPMPKSFEVCGKALVLVFVVGLLRNFPVPALVWVYEARVHRL